MMLKKTIRACLKISTSKTLLYDYTWIDCILEELNSMWFTKSSIGNKLWDEVNEVIEELERLRTFAICTAVSHGKQVLWKKDWVFGSRKMTENIPDPIDVFCHFEKALKKATREIRRASRKKKIVLVFGGQNRRRRENKRLSLAVSELRDTMAVFRPKMVEAYDNLSSSSHFQRWDRNHWDFLWKELSGAVHGDLTNLVFYDQYHREQGRKFRLAVSIWQSVKAPFEGLVKMHDSLLLFLDKILPGDAIVPTTAKAKCNDLLDHFESVFVRAAYFSYTWWWMGTDNDHDDERMDGEGEGFGNVVMDLLKRVMPKTTEAIDLCIQVLRASMSFTTSSGQTKNVVAGYLVHLLIPQMEQEKEVGNGQVLTNINTFRKGLAWLITFLIDAPDLYHQNDVELLLKDITTVTCELGGISYLFYYLTQDMPKETLLQPALVNLLEKMELLKVQLLLVELQKLMDLETKLTQYKNFEDLKYLRWLHKDSNELKRQQATLMMVPVRDRIDSVNEGLSFLVNIQNNKTLWTDTETLVSEASSVYDSFCANSITIEVATVEMVKLIDRIKLFKVEVILMQLLNSQPVLIENVKDQFQDLYEGVIFIRTFIMSPLDEIGKSILTRAEKVARDAGFLCCYSTEITEDVLGRMNLLLPELVEKMKLVRTEIMESYLRIRRSSQSNFPKNTGLGFVDFLLGNLRELLNQKADTIVSVKHLVEVAYSDIEEIVKSFPMDIVEQFNEQCNLINLRSCIVNVAYEVEYLVDSFVVKGGVLWYHVLWLSDLIEEIKLIKVPVSEISEKANSIVANNVEHSLSNYKVSPARIPNNGEVVVDLDDQTKLIIDRLIRGSSQQGVVSIVGMAGLGKTTLAKKLYTDPSVTYHFHVRAWCFVSQRYQKRKLLLDLLSNIVELTDDILEMTDDDLDFKLYQCLKQRRYLIVLDDLWSTDAWKDLETSLPNDKNGSRILITSRIPDVASIVRSDSALHRLRLLSDDESWKLLEKKLFLTEDCPEDLAEIGKQIAKSCKGLPLAVVAISGLLQRTKKTKHLWNEVAESLSSHIADDPETRCMDILEMSYKHLPNHLKPCFLYIGAFMADQEIPVRKLICLWIAEGFVQNAESVSLEDVAEEYLKDLIGRSLIIASKRKSNGGVKTCRVHDMLRTMCLVRCKEENFLQVVSGYNVHFDSSSLEDLDYGIDSNYSYPSSFITYETLRLSICSKRNHLVMLRPSGPRVRSLLFFAISDTYPRCPYNISFIPQNFKLLRVLDLEHINTGNSFPIGVEDLVHLRYLAICGDIDFIPASIVNLWNLETLLVKGLKGKVELPSSIWSMEKLRHVHVNNHAAFSLQDCKTAELVQLHSLITLSTPFLYGKDTEKIMRKLLKLRKLRCVFSQSQDDVGNQYEFPVLDFLMELESLKVYYSGRIASPHKFEFPLSLKKLTLSKFRIPWEYISDIGKLPNLEVLKLHARSFEGRRWDMKEGEFLKLKFLKLDTLNLAQWNASSDHLPKLQRLVLRNCRQLEKVPSDFGDVATLEIIEVQLCRPSVEDSVRRLKEEQLEMGIEGLQVLINGSSWEFCSSS
ncbi:hypothetical protein ACH5RR_039854 [Cinchona calisaya]|uniref:Uncharacterized protein n=1 Tax=Cinchona calisaya TaxID=153742 RepID=A0ABD2Y155_9GENT